MSKSVIFKLKFNHPNEKTTILKNVRYVKYICTRLNVMLNKNKTFGAFGNIEGINNIEDIKKEVFINSKNGITMYDSIVSLTEEEALKKGFEKRKSWEDLIKRQSKNIAKELGIKITDFKYVCAVHMEKGHPHAHLCFWEKNQSIQRTDIASYKLNNIRKSFNKDVFADEINELYKEDNKNLKSFKDEMKSFSEEIESILGLNKEEYKKYKKILLAIDEDCNIGKISNNNMKVGIIDDITLDIYRLKNKINNKGRLNYAFMTEEAKNEINKISKKIIENNIELKSTIYKYKKSRIDIVKFHTKNQNKLDKENEKIERDIQKLVGNQIILNLYKKFNIKEYEIRKEELQEKKVEYERQQIQNTLFSFIDDLSRKINHNNEILNNKMSRKRKDNLSLMAKKDLAKKIENQSLIDWEAER